MKISLTTHQIQFQYDYKEISIVNVPGTYMISYMLSRVIKSQYIAFINSPRNDRNLQNIPSKHLTDKIYPEDWHKFNVFQSRKKGVKAILSDALCNMPPDPN